MKTDIEIAQAAEPLPIMDIAAKLNIPEAYVTPYGRYKAKIGQIPAAGNKGKETATKLILVTAVTPTPAGEGKTTTTVGLGDALSLLKKNVVICLREPSLGPVFGVKGGAAGGGYAQVIPMEDINLHFTGDLHAITTANNLLAAMLDNHISQGNALGIDPRRVVWRRAADMNDRQLRFIIGGLNGRTNGVPREDGYDITAASEVMAVFCLSEDLNDLKRNLSNIVVAYTYDNKPVRARDLNAQGAMTALCKDAFNPNLVQTLEHTPAFVHGGPFANIAHGCNSVAATRLAMGLGDYVVTEAGFGADLGAEKFLDIKCRRMGVAPSAAVLVATARALKHHGGCPKALLNAENLPALKKGLPNLLRHIRNITEVFGLPCVVCVNRFPSDTGAEIEYILNAARERGVKAAVSDAFSRGGAGAVELAEKTLAAAERPNNFKFLYPLEDGLAEKIQTVARRIYGADGVTYSPEAARTIRELEKAGYGGLPVCIAKTQYSFSDDAKLPGAPEGFTVNIRQARLSAGAGFVVAIAGDIMTMPGLPKTPAAEMIDVDGNGVISGLF